MSENKQNGEKSTNFSDAAKLMSYDANKKSMGVAYLLWFFIGMFGAHRFYLGTVGLGLGILALTLVGLLFFPLLIAAGIWVLVDAFLIPGIIRGHNTKLAAELG